MRDAGRVAIGARFDSADEGAKARLVAALGLLARGGDAEAAELVMARLHDPAARVRRTAAIALGKLGGDSAAAALIARWDAGDVTPDERRALAEALGKLGGEPALARLRALTPGGDAELARLRERALLMADRSAKRGEPSSIAADVAPPTPLDVRLACRRGFAPLLVEELKSIGMGPRRVDEAHVEVALSAPWSTLFASRLWASASIRYPHSFQTSSRPRSRARSRRTRRGPSSLRGRADRFAGGSASRTGTNARSSGGSRATSPRRRPSS